MPVRTIILNSLLNKIISPFVFLFLILFLYSCGDSAVKVGVSFENKDTISSRSVSAKALNSSLQNLKDGYSGLGELVGSYTPTEFKLFIQEMVLYKFNDSELCIELDNELGSESSEYPERHQADFIEDVLLSPAEPIPAADYDAMFFFFFSDRVSEMDVGMGDDTDFTVQTETVITVDIPNYDNIWADESSDFNGFNVFQNNVDGSLSFDLKYVDPGKDIAPANFRPIEMFFYMKDTAPWAILSGYDGPPALWDTADSDTGALANHGATTDVSAVFLPVEGFSVPADATEVKFIVAWELEGPSSYQ